MPYLGSTPNASFSSRTKQDFTANGSTTAFTLSSAVASANDIEVFVGNVRQEPTDAYTVNGTTLTMSAAPANGLNFYVVFKGVEENSVVPADGTISSAKIASNAVTDAKIQSSAITDAKIAVDAVTTAKIASGAVEYAKLDQTLGAWNKLTDVSIASNTAPQMMFHSILNGPYQYYKVIGKIGGSVSVGDANMQLRWVTGTGTDISGSSYHSANTGYLSDGNFNSGSGLNHSAAYILVHTSTGTSNFVDMTLIPSLAYGFGHIHTHDQSTHIGVTTFGFKYNAGFSDISGIKVYPSGGNMTEVDLTVYGMKLSGSLGG